MAEENPENENEEGVEKNKGKTNLLNLTKSSREDFIKTKISEDMDFFDGKKDTIHRDFLDYIKNKSEYEEILIEINSIGKDELEKINYKFIQEAIIQRVGIDKNIATAKKILNNEYKIKDFNLLDKKLKEIYKGQNGRKNIINIIKNKLYRQAFIVKKLEGSYEQLEKNEDYILENIIKKIKGYDDLGEKEKEELNNIYDTKMDINTKNLKDLLGFLNVNDRNIILKDLNPSFNLKDLIDLEILTKEEANNRLKKELKSNYSSLTQSEISLVFSNLEYEKIYITFDDLKKGEQIAFLDSDKAIDNLAKQLNEEKDTKEKSENLFLDDNLLPLEIKEGNNGEYETYIHNNFKNFIQNDYGKNLLIETKNSIANFDKGGYIKLTTADGKDLYYYVDEKDLGSTKAGKHIVVKSLSSESGVKLPENSTSENMTYENLYKLMVNTKNKGGNFEFLNKISFNKEDIEKSPDEKNIHSEKDLRELLYNEGFLEESAKNKSFDQLKFKDKEKGEEFYRSFSNFNDNKHELTFSFTGQNISYSDFYDEFKKANKFKLVKKINNFQELINESEFLKNKNIVLHKDGNKLVYKDDENLSDAKEIKFFICEKSGDTITIDKVSENGIKFTTGKVKKELDIKKKNNKGKEEKVGTKYDIENKYLLDDFDHFLLNIDESNKLFKPLEKGSKASEKDNSKPLEQKGGFFGKIFTLGSILELIKGGEMAINAIKEFLERGNDLRSAKFAEKFGSFLPSDVQEKLKFTLTEKRKETIEKIFKELTEQDSTPAMNRIFDRILSNKNALPEETYAAIRFMLKKRGGLYAKNPLIGRRDDFVWYQKLGGKKGDAFYTKLKSKIDKQGEEETAAGKKDPVFFTEELLLEHFLKEKRDKDHKFLYPRVEKDYKKDLSEGQANRNKKGEEEGGDEFTVTKKLEYFKNHLANGEKSRALGAFKKIISKNSNFSSMYAPGFLVAMSGVSKTMNGGELNQLSQAAYASPSSGLMFSTSEDGIQTYQNALINFYDNTGRNDKAKKLKEILSYSMDKRIKSLYDFWSENSQSIIDFYNLKDGYIFENKGTEKDKNGYFQKIYQTYNGGMNSSEYKVTIEDSLVLGEGHFDDTSIADVGAKLNLIDGTATGGYRGNESRWMTRLYLRRLDEIKKLDILPVNKKILFNNVFGKFEEKIGKAIGQYISSKNITDGEMYIDIHNSGLLIQKIDGYRELTREEFLDIAYDHFMGHEFEENSIERTSEDIYKKVDNTLNGQINENKIYPTEDIQDEEPLNE